MSRQTDLLARNQSTDTPHYTFVLDNKFFGTRVLQYAPGSWDDDEFQFSRDMKSFGVFRKFAGSVLNFYKDGRDFHRNCYEGFGPNCRTTLKVTEFTPQRVSKTKFEGTHDYNTYGINDLSVNLKVIDGSFTDKILSRAKTEVNIKGNRSIDNDDIGDISIEIITLPAINIDQVANWLDGSATWYGATHNLPIGIIVNEFSEAQAETTSTPFFVDSLVEYLDCRFGIAISGLTKGSANDAAFDFIFTLERWNGGSWAETLWTETISGAGDTEDAFSITDQINGITVNEGDSLLYKVTRVNTVGTGQIQYGEIQASMHTVIETIAQRLIDAMLYHEAFERIIAHYCGEMGRFKSDFFGRTDIGYAVDGEIGSITTGRNIRLQFGINPTMALSLEKLFKSLQSIFNLGMGIEVIGGVEMVVIEPMEYFFNTNLVLDLSDRIDFTTIEKKVETPLIHSAINCGYGSYDYLRVGGIYEFNTTNRYTTVVKYLESTLDLVSPYRADESGVLAILSEEFNNKDVKGEADIFILDTIRDGGGYIVATDEKIVQSNDYSNRDTLLNLWLTPGRMVRRWDRYINAFLRWDQGSYLKWQSSDKNSLLQSTEAGKAQIVENADIPATEFRTPLWICETYEFEVPIDTADFDSIEANPYGLFKIGPDTYGFLLDYKAKNENNKSSFKLLRYNNAYASIQTSSIPPVTFGQLYNWYTVNDERSIAPEGWHVPTEAEITTLRTYLGGSTVAGGKMKEIGLEKWNTPNTGADNSSGFNGRGAGSRDYSDGAFSGLKEALFIWASDQHSSVAGHYGGLFYNSAAMSINYNFKSFGLSVRLVKDSTDLTNGQTGTMTGNNGNIYRTICIGTQEWMADNLNEDMFLYAESPLALSGYPANAGYVRFYFHTTDSEPFIDIELSEGDTIEDVYDRIIIDSTYIALAENGLFIIYFDGIYMWIRGRFDCWFTVAQGNEALSGSDVRPAQIPEVTDPTAWAALTTPARCYYDNDINNA